MNRVLDACAMIAYLRDEPGADVVTRILQDPDSTCFAHALNLSEVYRDFLHHGEETAAEAAVSALTLVGVTIREDLDAALWKDAARLKNTYRMSLADSIGIALARRLSADFISTDHHELDTIDAAGVHVITFAR